MKDIYIGIERRGDFGRTIIDFLLNLIYQPNSINWVDGRKGTYKNIDFMVSSSGIGKWWNTKPKKYIIFSGEPVILESSPRATSKFYITTTKETITDLFIPYCLFSPHLYKESQYKENTRPFLVAYCNNNYIQERETMFSLLVEKSNNEICHSLSVCNGNKPETQKPKPEGAWDSQNLIETYSQYNFVIAMENCRKEGYVTEKLINAYYSGAIPIYWGAPDIEKYFNTKAFINVSDFESFEQCADYIVNMPQSKIKEMQNEDLYIDSPIINILREETVYRQEAVIKLKTFLEK